MINGIQFLEVSPQRGFQRIISRVFLEVVTARIRNQIGVDGVHFADKISRAPRLAEQIFKSLRVADLDIACAKSNASHQVISGAALLVEDALERRQPNPTPRD